MGIPEQIVCRLTRIEQLLVGGIPASNPTTGALYTNDFISEQVLDLTNAISMLTIPAGANYCEIEVKGNGTVLRRMVNNPTLTESNQFLKNDLFALTSIAEMSKTKFTSTTNNKLFINYYKIISL